MYPAYCLVDASKIERSRLPGKAETRDLLLSVVNNH
jgi:hypothetical protein